MGQFEKLLEYVKGLNKNTSEQGTWFENFMKYVFLTSPVYQELYEKVWTWTEFPYNGGRHDFGIDLVAKIRDMDEYVAIQCKFYDEEYSVSKSDVDTFLTASGKPFYIKGVPVRYSGRIIVSTTDRWTSTANDIIEGQIPAVTRIRLKDLKEIGIDWDSVSLENPASMKQSDKKIMRPHQKEAIAKVLEGFETADRGKLIMACGTGKTFTALKIVEAITQGNGNVLFLVPSISLLNQTLLEWTKECIYNYQVYAICSDPKVTKSKAETVDTLADTIVPATTDVESLVEGYTNLWNVSEKKTLRFFFSTYQSIDVISEFEKITGLEFDITVCDEAHRTTGVTLAGEDESSFVKVHNNDIIRTKKRLYMTATPRIYADESKQKAANNSALLCSMDDEAVYGKDFYVLGFADSVSMGLLSDYKVIVLAVDEGYVSKTLQNLLTNSDSELTLDDSVKILGCLNGLSKKTLYDNEQDYFENDPYKMKRAVAFCSDIKSSKKFVQLFGEIQDEIKLYGADQDLVTVELQHVDGTQNALYRKECIDWLKEDTSENVCRILSNARCLSEGIDVPALDAVMFLNPKNSIVDIIQSVGRVMRKAEGKNFGYIILPIGIPAGVEPEEALGDNKKYKIVWDVLQALRAHDDRFNNTINKIELNRKKPANIQIIGVTGKGEGTDNETQEKYSQLTMKFDELQKWKESIYAKIVKKCGTRKYWETWAKDIADIANRHIAEIELLIERPEISGKFNEFLSALQSNLNSSIEKDDAKDYKGQSSRSEDVMQKSLLSAEDIFAMKKDGECAIVVKGTEPLYQTKCQMEKTDFVKLLCRKKNPYDPRKQRIKRERKYKNNDPVMLSGKKAREEAKRLLDAGEEIRHITVEEALVYKEAIKMEVAPKEIVLSMKERQKLLENAKRYEEKHSMMQKITLEEFHYNSDGSVCDQKEYERRCLVVRSLINNGFSNVLVRFLKPLISNGYSYSMIRELFNENSEAEEVRDFIKQVKLA